MQFHGRGHLKDVTTTGVNTQKSRTEHYACSEALRGPFLLEKG